jgi:amino acid transporter
LLDFSGLPSKANLGLDSYALQWLIVLPLEIVAASLVLTYWNPNIVKAGYVTLFLFIIISINLFGVRGYGEAEFIFAIIKVIAVIGFMFVCTLPHIAKWS